MVKIFGLMLLVASATFYVNQSYCSEDDEEEENPPKIYQQYPPMHLETMKGMEHMNKYPECMEASRYGEDYYRCVYRT